MSNLSLLCAAKRTRAVAFGARFPDLTRPLAASDPQGELWGAASMLRRGDKTRGPPLRDGAIALAIVPPLPNGTPLESLPPTHQSYSQAFRALRGLRR